MAKAQMIGGPDDGREVSIDPGIKTIEIHVNGERYVMPVRDRRIYWNERRKL